jgi:hypothetical protein
MDSTTESPRVTPVHAAGFGGGGASSAPASVSPDAAGATDAGALDAPPPPNPAACTGVTRGDSVVESITRPGDAPAPLGGTIVPGTYDLEYLSLYSGKPADPPADPDAEAPTQYPVGVESAQITLVVTDDAIRRATGVGDLTDGGFASEELSTGWYTVDGTALEYEEICPTRDRRRIGFTADEATLSLQTRPDRWESYRRR